MAEPSFKLRSYYLQHLHSFHNPTLPNADTVWSGADRGTSPGLRFPLPIYLPTYLFFFPPFLSSSFFPSFFSFSLPATYVFKNITMVVEMFSVFGAVGSPGQLGLPHYPKLHHLLILYREQRGEIQIWAHSFQVPGGSVVQGRAPSSPSMGNLSSPVRGSLRGSV